MTVEREERGSDVPFVAAVTRVRYGTACHDVTTPDGLWDIVIQRHAGKVTVLQTGLITSPVALDYLEGDEYLSISFRPGVFMPRLPGERMVDTAVVRPLTTERTFTLDSDELEIPSFENAEGLVERLVKHGILVRDQLVSEVAEGGADGLSPRTVQRHSSVRWGSPPSGWRRSSARTGRSTCCGPGVQPSTSR